MIFVGKSPTFELSKMVSENKKDEKSYLLKNKRNKCMSSGRLNPYGPYETVCNPKDKDQHWKWCGDGNICNHSGKLLSKTHSSTAPEPNGKIVKIFSIKLLGLDKSKTFNQKWRATNLGQLVDSIDGLCLGIACNSVDRQHFLLAAKTCDEKDDGQFWSFIDGSVPMIN